MVRKREAVATSDSDIIQIMHVMAHPARLRLLNALRSGEECVCHLTALLHQRQAYVSQQLTVLREAGLIQDRKESYRVYCRIKDLRVFPLLDAINVMRGERAHSFDQQAMANCPCPRCKPEGRHGAVDDGPQVSGSKMKTG
jgi:DNA-binding transcriptional ArsR family regulator